MTMSRRRTRQATTEEEAIGCVSVLVFIGFIYSAIAYLEGGSAVRLIIFAIMTLLCVWYLIKHNLRLF